MLKSATVESQSGDLNLYSRVSYRLEKDLKNQAFGIGGKLVYSLIYHMTIINMRKTILTRTTILHIRVFVKSSSTDQIDIIRKS